MGTEPEPSTALSQPPTVPSSLPGTKTKTNTTAITEKPTTDIQYRSPCVSLPSFMRISRQHQSTTSQKTSHENCEMMMFAKELLGTVQSDLKPRPVIWRHRNQKNHHIFF